MIREHGLNVTRPSQRGTAGWETIEELFAALESPLLSYACAWPVMRAAEDIVQEAL